MKINNNSVVVIGSVLNCLFAIALPLFDKYWDNISGWISYPYILLMIINATILIVYATKNRK